MIKELLTEQDVHHALDDSRNHPILLLKHSTQCSISAAAWREFTRFSEGAPEVDCRWVAVIEHRPLSDLLTSLTGVRHESPQAMLLVDGQAVWSASHRHITLVALRAAIAAHTASSPEK